MRLRFKFVGSIYEQQIESERRFIGPMTYLSQAGSIGSPEACTSGPFLSSRDWLIAIANEKLEPIRRIKPDLDDEQAHKWREASVDVLKKSPLLDSDSCDHEQIVLSHIDYSLHNILSIVMIPLGSSLWLTGMPRARFPCGLPIQLSGSLSCYQMRRSATSNG